MKRRPYSTVGFPVTQECDFFRRHWGKTKRVKQKDQLAVLAAANERIEVARPLRRIEVGQRAKLRVVMQFFAQDLLVAAIEVSRFGRLRAAGSHLCIWGTLNFIESLVGKANHQMRERFREFLGVDKKREGMFF